MASVVARFNNNNNGEFVVVGWGGGGGGGLAVATMSNLNLMLG